LTPASGLKIKPNKKTASRATFQKIVTSITTAVKNTDPSFTEILSAISEQQA
jgi:hypothetical protein